MRGKVVIFLVPRLSDCLRRLDEWKAGRQQCDPNRRFKMLKSVNNATQVAHGQRAGPTPNNLFRIGKSLRWPRLESIGALPYPASRRSMHLASAPTASVNRANAAFKEEGDAEATEFSEREVRIAGVLQSLGKDPLTRRMAKIAAKFLDVYRSTVCRVRKRFSSVPSRAPWCQGCRARAPATRGWTCA